MHDKEMLAVIQGLKEFRPWLSGTVIPISVITDHKNLEYFMAQRQLNRRQARWMLELTEFNFRLSYAPGSKNPADGPSRRNDYLPNQDDPAITGNYTQLLTPEICERLHPSATIANLTSIILDSSNDIHHLSHALESDPIWKKGIETNHPAFANRDGIVTHHNRLYIPPSLRQSIIKSRHDSALAGHFGVAKTLELVRRDFSWPSVSRDVRSYVRGCDSCQRVKSAHHAPYGKLQPLDIPSRPWQSISMDFITGLPPSHAFDAILVIVDRLTKQSHFIPTTTTVDAPALAWLYLSNVVKLHGVAESIISDRGSVFVSSFWKALQHLLHTDLKLSTAYHPQTDGQTERINAILENYLRHYCSYQQDDWVDYLPLAEFAYNNAAHEGSRVSPFYANYGYHPTFSTPLSRIINVPAASDFADHLARIREELRSELLHAQQAAKTKYDRNRTSPPSFSVGDRVMLLRRNLKTTRPSEKLDFRKIGPFKVAKKLSDNVYQLQLPPTMARLHPVFNINLLEPYIAPSDFPGRSDNSSSAIPILEDESSPGSAIKEFLDVRRVGRRFDYFVDYENQPPTERAWIPLSDIPTTYNEALERFHRRNPRLPRPADSTLLRARPLYPSSSTHAPVSHPSPLADSDSPAPSANSTTDTSLGADNVPSTDASPIPSHAPRAHSPIPNPSLRVAYTPPTITTTRSGRQSRPRNLDALTTAITQNRSPAELRSRSKRGAVLRDEP